VPFKPANRVSSDKEEIRIKSIPVIKDGLILAEAVGGSCFPLDPHGAEPNHYATPLHSTPFYKCRIFILSS